MRTACIAIFLLGVAGCATLGDRGLIGVSIVNLRLQQASLLETSAELTVRYTNESTEPVMLAGAAHRLYLNDTYVGRGVTSEHMTIPALGTTTQNVVVYLENLTLFRKAAELSGAQSPAVAYRLESRLHPAEGSALGGLRLTSAGELDLGTLTGRPGPLAAPKPQR